VISGATRVAAVIGDPVRHSLSPRLHNAAYAALDLDWLFAAFEVPDGGAERALAAARTFDFVGLSVTMPHKRSVGLLCDDVSDRAAEIRSVNTVTFEANGEAIGDSTDGAGFVRSLTDEDVDVAGRSVLVLGAGGAARAVVWALADAGAQLAVAARTRDAAAAIGRSDVIPWDDRAAAVAGVDIVVNATSVGMGGDTNLPVPAGAITKGQVVADLVYEPRETPLLVAARDRGAQTVGGIGMLVHQAALQVEIWSGRPAPIEAMHAAVRPR
jgi:shikimate dehydrogenase